MVVSGYIMQVHMRPFLNLLGLFELPRQFHPGEDESLRVLAWYIHGYTLWLLLGLIALHSGAALWHHFVWKDDVLVRMAPSARKRSGRRKGDAA